MKRRGQLVASSPEHPGRTTRVTMNTNNNAASGPNLDRMRQPGKGN
jgi:hypothetical protein